MENKDIKTNDNFDAVEKIDGGIFFTVIYTIALTLAMWLGSNIIN